MLYLRDARSPSLDIFTYRIPDRCPLCKALPLVLLLLLPMSLCCLRCAGEVPGRGGSTAETDTESMDNVEMSLLVSIVRFIS